MDRGTVIRATAWSDEPIPLDAIDIIRHQARHHPRDLVLCLGQRLDKLDWRVKLKALQLLRSLLDSSDVTPLPAAFKRIAQRELADTLRVHQTYSSNTGAPSTMIKQIRDQAKKCHDLLFIADSADAASSDPLPSLGAACFSEPVYGSTYSSRIQGFGSEGTDGGNCIATRHPAHLSDELAGWMTRVATNLASGFTQQRHSTVNGVAGCSFASATWAANPNAGLGAPRPSSCSVSPRNGAASGTSAHAPVQPLSRQLQHPTIGPKSDGSFEKVVVERFLNAGGARLMPSTREAREFAHKCAGLDAVCIAEILLSKTVRTEVPERTRLRALFTMQALLRVNRVPDAAPLHDAIEHVTKTHRNTLRHAAVPPAGKVALAEILDDPSLTSSTVGESSRPGSVVQGPGTGVDLLDIADETQLETSDVDAADLIGTMETSTMSPCEAPASAGLLDDEKEEEKDLETTGQEESIGLKTTTNLLEESADGEASAPSAETNCLGNTPGAGTSSMYPFVFGGVPPASDKRTDTQPQTTGSLLDL